MFSKKIKQGMMVVFSFSLLMFQCAIFSSSSKEITDAQKEEDIIELLNTQQVQPPETQSSTEEQKLAQQITELEKQKLSNLDEIEKLKSEIVLRDERLRQLMSSTKAETEKTISAQQQEEPPSSISNFEAEYIIALNAFNARQYEDAKVRFENLLKLDRNNALSDNSQYWIGECYFALKDYRRAIIAFEAVLPFRNSNKNDDAQFKLGYTYYQMGDMTRAKENFNKLINLYPESEYIDRAKSFLAKIGS